MEKAIKVSKLRKSFHNNPVLSGVDFEVAGGEIFALLGSNGAGKTTTIKILTTLLRADSGTAEVCGFDVSKQGREVREAISLTGQSVAVDDVLTGRENLIMIGRLRHIADPKGEAGRQLEAFGLQDAADKPLSQYSGGMRRRLDLAMSMLGNPKVVFLDEPTTGLDPQSRIAVWNTIRDMAQSGVTILLTTQYLDEAEQLASHIAILHGGRIIADGSLEELKSLFPPAKVEYIEKQPSLEEIFLAIVGEGGVK
ncbi:MAG: ATP-binding cassette domain-containing protein [Gracilibacteraceae bacterium]|jgi:ABC-2 type transport system ATP-binding protein|nr:ATP-binding cassette domain-containing protein [Gracilibacteraceae bacterium]